MPLRDAEDSRAITTPRDETRKPQFSLRGLLWFMVACSAYFSMLGATGRLAAGPQKPDAGPWLVTVLVTWLILLLFLRTKGVRGMLVAQFVGPIVGLGLSFLRLDNVQLSVFGFEGSLVATVLCCAVGCFVSSLLSFPLSVLRTIVLALWQK
jgi:hypothetical protein